MKAPRTPFLKRMVNPRSKAWHGVTDKRNTETPQKKKGPEFENPFFG